MATVYCGLNYGKLTYQFLKTNAPYLRSLLKNQQFSGLPGGYPDLILLPKVDSGIAEHDKEIGDKSH